MRGLLAALAVLAASLAQAAPIQDGLTVRGFFDKLEKAAKDLAEGGMDMNRVHCVEDGTLCGGYYGAGTTVVARGPSKTAGMESVTINQEIPGETEDFWLTSALVMEILDGNFKTIPERSQMILNAMRGASGTFFEGNIGRYTFERSPENLSKMVVTGR